MQRSYVQAVRRAAFPAAAAALLACGAAGFAAERQADTTKEKSADKADKIICKRFVETGSLVKGYRTCKTKREWDAARSDIRATAVTSGSCNSGESGSCF